MPFKTDTLCYLNQNKSLLQILHERLTIFSINLLFLFCIYLSFSVCFHFWIFKLKIRLSTLKWQINSLEKVVKIDVNSVTKQTNKIEDEIEEHMLDKLIQPVDIVEVARQEPLSADILSAEKRELWSHKSILSETFWKINKQFSRWTVGRFFKFAGSHWLEILRKQRPTGLDYLVHYYLVIVHGFQSHRTARMREFYVTLRVLFNSTDKSLRF